MWERKHAELVYMAVGLHSSHLLHPPLSLTHSFFFLTINSKMWNVKHMWTGIWNITPSLPNFGGMHKVHKKRDVEKTTVRNQCTFLFKIMLLLCIMHIQNNRGTSAIRTYWLTLWVRERVQRWTGIKIQITFIMRLDTENKNGNIQIHNVN